MELFDSKNAELAQTANADDVIIGSELLSNYLVQITRIPERHSIYEELLTAGGSEIYIKPLRIIYNKRKGHQF
jgi:ion channel POLLUX/CASTOR